MEAFLGYLAGISTLLTVEWLKAKRHQQRMRRVAKAWFAHRDGVVTDYLLLRDIGIYTHDPDLIYKAAVVYQLQQLSDNSDTKSLGLTPRLFELAEEMKPWWKRFTGRIWKLFWGMHPR